MLTFDDGWLGNYLHVFPILKNFGFSAFFFIALDRIGKNGFMTWELIRTLKDHDMAIASHTMSHRPLNTLNKEEIYYELWQ